MADGRNASLTTWASEVSRRTRLVVAAIASAVAAAAAVMVLGALDGDGSDTGGTAHTRAIPQPLVTGLPVAPRAQRVDLAAPTFSRPTTVDNPLFPVSGQRSVLLVGHVDGLPFRTEVTLLPDTRIVEWEGRRVETLVSQYVAFLDGRIEEVAYDLYAQDDAGAVWYFGEDVFNFADGAIVDTRGTWLAGKDGPAAMIMPAQPKVGDRYRAENIPGLVFEEVTVRDVRRTLAGPLGPVPGGIVVEELHMDGGRELKTFAPGYGEFLTTGDGDLEAVALAVPTDAASTAAPTALRTLERSAGVVFAAVGTGQWGRADSAAARLRSAWATTRSGAVPRRVEPELDRALARLSAAVAHRRSRPARQSAIDVARWSLDLQLRHRPVPDIDLARLDLWAAQVLVDAAAGDAAAVNGDLFSIDYVRDRVQHSIRAVELVRLNVVVEELSAAVADDDLDAAARFAQRLRAVVAARG